MQEERLWASSPIWYDQSDPPAQACWLYALQLAQELRSLKVKLPRAVVPPAGGGPCIHMRASQALAEQQAVLSGPHKRQRTKNQQGDAPSGSTHHAQQARAEKQADVPSISGYQTQLRTRQQLADEPSSCAVLAVC